MENLTAHKASFPTRRSSDLDLAQRVALRVGQRRRHHEAAIADPHHRLVVDTPDRKSTRLNSSHITISYAVFCLKKKTGTHVTSKTINDSTDTLSHCHVSNKQ